jgi:hypothetical protein
MCIHQNSSRNHELSQQSFYCATLRQMHAYENSLLIFKSKEFCAREFKEGEACIIIATENLPNNRPNTVLVSPLKFLVVVMKQVLLIFLNG